MATATAVWSPLCAPTDLARQRSRSDAVGGGDSVSTRNVGLPGRSEDLYHAGRRSCGENQRENFCSTQDKVMDRLCGQLDELLKRVGAVGPSPFILRPQRDGVTQFNTSSAESRTASDRTSEHHLSRGSAGLGAAQPPTWTPKREALDTRSHNAGNGRGRDGEWPASEAVQRRRESPEVDHFFKAGQVCSRGENCSFAHSVRELKPLQVPPFRRKHQTTPFRSSFASSAAQPASTYPTAATAHSQAAPSGGVAAAHTPPAPAAAEPGQDSQILGSASSAAHGGVWQESGGTTGRDGTAHNSGSSTGSSLYDAQQRLLYSDLRHLSEARLGSLLASVQDKGKGSSPLSAAAPTAARAAQKQQPSASHRHHGGETYFSSPSDCHALQRYLHPRKITLPPSTASPVAHSFPRGSPSATECPLEPRQQARRLQQLEGVVTRLSCVQRSAGDQPPAARGAAEPSSQQPNREDQRRVRFVADGGGVRDQQPRAPSTAYLLCRQEEQQLTFTTAASARPAAPGCSQAEEQQHLVAAAAAAELRHCEDRSWLKEASLAVSELWHNSCRSPQPGLCSSSNAQTPESSPVALTGEADSFCHHLTGGGRAVKKSRRGKRGGRKKRGTGHPAGGSSAEQHEQQLYVEQKQHQEDATGEERTADDCSSYVERASKSSSTWGRPDRFFFGEVDTPEAMKSLPQRGEGSAASTCFSEGTPSTSAVGERCSASRVFSAGTVEGDAFLHFLDPGQKEGANPLGVDEEDNEEKHSAQLLLEALHAHVAAVGDSAARACDLEIAAPSLLLSAAPAASTLSLSSLPNTKTLYSGKDLPGEEKKQATPAFFSKEDTDTVPFGDEVRQMETSQEVLTKLLQGGETQQLLLQCIREIVRQTPPTSSPSEILSTLQLLSTSFGDKTGVVADIPAAADAADEAAKKREMHAAAVGRREREDGAIEKGCFIQEKIWLPDDSKYPVLPAQGGKCMSSPFIDFNFGLIEKEKESLNDRHTAVDLAPGTSAGAAVASILELLTDEDEGTKTGSAVGQQQASTRYSSRCGLSQEEAGSLVFGGLAAEAGSPVVRSSVGGNRAGAITAAASGEYVSGFFTPSFPVAATSTTSLSPWV